MDKNIMHFNSPIRVFLRAFPNDPIRAIKFFKKFLDDGMSRKGYILAVCGPKLLRNGVNACEAFGVKPFLLFGTLRGFVLKNDFLPRSEDIDFGLLENDFQKVCLIKTFLIKAGYRLVLDNEYQLQVKHPAFPSLCLDIFRVRQSGENMVVQVLIPEEKVTYSLFFPKRIFQDFQKVEFQGIKVLVPQAMKEVLAIHYLQYWQDPPKKPSLAEQKHVTTESIK